MQLIDAAPLRHFPQPLRLGWQRCVLHFKRPAATSRGALTERITYIIEAETPEGIGFGECCIMPGLFAEIQETELNEWCRLVEKLQGLPEEIAPSPIQFGLECALLAAINPGRPRWDTPFARGECGIPIHHLIWMDNCENMLTAMQEGVDAGFSCLKMKVGALPFAQEIEMLHEAHAAFPNTELRVDANGAFSPQEARTKLEALAAAGVSFIEQPIRPGQWKEMAELCRQSPLPIALDEELIHAPIHKLLESVRPQAIVLKPSMHGGLLKAQQLAKAAEERGIRWWVNSALESSVGLTALAEWSAYAAPGQMQGLGTGRLFTDDAPGSVQLMGNRLQMQQN